jgi:acetyl-CoA acetyltransferase
MTQQDKSLPHLGEQHFHKGASMNVFTHRVAAENIADKFGFTKDDLNQFALQSYHKYTFSLIL